MATVCRIDWPQQPPDHDARLRRQAVAIAAQLPMDRREALLVLEMAREQVVEFFDSLGPSTGRGAL
jgi:hypothetical protein